MSFWDARFLWLDVVIASAAVAAATAAVGIHTTLRRVVFLPAALSQLAGAGVVVAFLLAHFLAASPGHNQEMPDQETLNLSVHAMEGGQAASNAAPELTSPQQSSSSSSSSDDQAPIPMADEKGVFDADDSPIPMADEKGVFGDQPAPPQELPQQAASAPAPQPADGEPVAASEHPYETAWSLPWLMALLFASVGALTLGFVREGRLATRGWLLGAVYIAASATVLLLGGFVQQEMHDVNDVLFGNAIAISTGQMVQALAVSLAILVLHLYLAPLFLAYAFDPITARAHGFPVRLLDGVLFLSMGLVIAAGTRVVGALPEFAFAVFPGMAALNLVRNARWVVALAAAIGALVAFVGYWASFVLSLPTGATMAATALLALLVAKPLGWLRGGFRT